MDNAIANPLPTKLIPVAPAATGVGARWQSLPARTQVGAMFGVAALLAVLAFMTLGARDSNYRPLYSNLSDKEGGQVIDRLTQLNVPYKFTEGGSVILVPSQQVHPLRMKLAAAGLNVGSGSTAPGYELLDKNNFGQTQGQERMKMQRVTEGELITTIQSLESVKAARVHLALPNQNGFFREQQKPSASVVLTLHPGRTLERSQVAGIVRLVSGSVPELANKAVSVVDSTGALLSGPGEDDGAQGLDSQQLQYRRELEAGLHKRVLALLEPVVGSDNVRVSITGDIDFNQVMQTAEAYRPNQGEDAKPAIREQRTEESNQPGSSTPAGIPGAMSNQPTAAATAPINGASQAMQGTQTPGGVSGGAQRREAATRFEVDKTVTVTRNAVGTVRRLSAAVVVNHRSSTDAKGKTTSAPLSDKEIEQLTALVQQGIGFNAERGDVVKIVNAPFRQDVVPKASETPVWQQPWLLDLLKSAAAPLALALVALFVVSKLIKPAVTAVLNPPPPVPGSQVDEIVADDRPTPNALPALMAPDASDKIDQARALAKANPAAVANIVRGWVNGEAA